MNDLMPFKNNYHYPYMFIGAAPASTAGGIKITTVALVVCTVISVLKGQRGYLSYGSQDKA